jgi:hypothetical protein
MSRVGVRVTHTRRVPDLLVRGGVLLVLAVSVGCGEEATKDATKSGQVVDRSPAKVLAMPDKFRNVALKCDGYGHRVYMNSTGDSGNSANIFVLDDPKCPGGTKK